MDWWFYYIAGLLTNCEAPDLYEMPAPLDNLFCEVFADLVMTSPTTAFRHYLYPYHTVKSFQSDDEELVCLPAKSPLKYKACYFVALTEFLQTKDMASRLGKVTLHPSRCFCIAPLHILPFYDCKLHSENGIGMLSTDCLLFPAPKQHPCVFFKISCTDCTPWMPCCCLDNRRFSSKSWEILVKNIVALQFTPAFFLNPSCFCRVQSQHPPQIKNGLNLATTVLYLMQKSEDQFFQWMKEIESMARWVSPRPSSLLSLSSATGECVVTEIPVCIEKWMAHRNKNLIVAADDSSLWAVVQHTFDHFYIARITAYFQVMHSCDRWPLLTVQRFWRRWCAGIGPYHARLAV